MRKSVLLSTVIAAQSLIAVAVVLGLRWGRSCWSDRLSGIDRQQDRSFTALRSGMLKADVFARMRRPPLWTNSEFTLGQYQGNEREYAKTNGLHAQVFYTWDNGDLFYCVGFDTNALLVVKGKGGT
jgi:hypothetical protein